MRRYSMDSRAPADTLTRREWHVLRLLNTGMKNADIGREVGRTESTIKNVVKNVFDKLGVDNRTEAALWVERHRHLDPETREKFKTGLMEGNFEGTVK